MFSESILYEALISGCPYIHENRLNAVLDVAKALQDSKNLSLSEMGRHLGGEMDIKHKIKKVDRLEGNSHLHRELHALYKGLSDFVFTYISQDKQLPIVIDVCFMKDDKGVQMLSAETTSKGRTIPLYREVFKGGELKGRAKPFIANLSALIPSDREVIVIMDAGFYEDWFRHIESQGWYWVCRIRQGRSIQLSQDSDWLSVKDFIGKIQSKTKNYPDVLLTRRHKHLCRIVTTRRARKGRVVKVTRGKTTDKIGSGSYRDSAKEPWILATNLPSDYKGSQVVKYYSKRMQIEESFRDVKSHQFGLCGRYVRTKCTHRWGVKMLLAAIVQITYWVIGVIGHSQNMQRYFQANTVRDRKVFSYFTLGKLIIEHGRLPDILNSELTLAQVIQQELARDW